MAGSGKAVSSNVEFPTFNGAIDWKHVVLQCPRNSASEHFNYKNVFSIVLFAIVDANYKFMFVDAGCQGRISDIVFLRTLSCIKNWKQKPYVLLSLFLLNGTVKSVPYFFIGDEAFPLGENLTKVYPGQHPKGSKERIFKYSICRARRV
jgi:hypothetical protein